MHDRISFSSLSCPFRQIGIHFPRKPKSPSIFALLVSVLIVELFGGNAVMHIGSGSIGLDEWSGARSKLVRATIKNRQSHPPAHRLPVVERIADAMRTLGRLKRPNDNRASMLFCFARGF
jgi:hypothetical protein